VISVVIVAAFIAVAVVLVTESNGVDDGPATDSYLKARSALDNASLELLPQARASVARYVSRTSRECPGALRAEPGTAKPVQTSHGSEVTTSPAQQLAFLDEAGAAIRIAFNAPRAAALATFNAAVDGLSWSSAELTRAVHALAGEEAASGQARAPRLCADVGAWVASGYRHAPPERQATPTILLRVGLAPLDAPAQPACPIASALRIGGLLERQESGTSRRMGALVERAERRFTAEEQSVEGTGELELLRALKARGLLSALEHEPCGTMDAQQVSRPSDAG
jgi:hypothetical protein